MAPAKPLNLLLDEEKPYAIMVFDDDELAVAIKPTGFSRLKKVVKKFKFKKDIQAADYLSDDDGFEYVNTKNLSSKTDKYEEVVNE